MGNDVEAWLKDETNTPYGVERVGNKPHAEEVWFSVKHRT